MGRSGLDAAWDAAVTKEESRAPGHVAGCVFCETAFGEAFPAGGTAFFCFFSSYIKASATLILLVVNLAPWRSVKSFGWVVGSGSDLHDDRQNHGPALQALVDELLERTPDPCGNERQVSLGLGNHEKQRVRNDVPDLGKEFL